MTNENILKYQQQIQRLHKKIRKEMECCEHKFVWDREGDTMEGEYWNGYTCEICGSSKIEEYR